MSLKWHRNRDRELRLLATQQAIESPLVVDGYVVPRNPPRVRMPKAEIRARIIRLVERYRGVVTICPPAPRPGKR